MFLIRADGNEKIGAGHLMRCLTIAAELAKQGSGDEILFLCADEQSACLAGQQGFEAFALGTDYRDMESELPVWEKLFAERDSKTVILVDSYHVTDRYLAALRRFGTVVLMDDMGKKPYPVDALINYNAFADRTCYSRLYIASTPEPADGDIGHCAGDVKQFIGSDYVPVREQFRDRNYCVRPKVNSVLITTGGGDSENIAGKILETLYEEDPEYHLIVGQFNSHLAKLKQMEDTHENIHIHSNVTDMAELMTSADIAVTAGGSTVYELAVLGVPLICFSYAENQEALTEYIGAQNIAGFAGAFHKSPEAVLANMGSLFRRLTSDETLRRQYSDRERKMIDGYGALRLAQALRSLKGDML